MSKLRKFRQGGFLYLTLDDAPTRNALSPEMVDELRAALEAAAADGGVRAVVLRGANGTFCAGGSMGSFQKSQQTTPAAGEHDPIAANNRRFGEFMTMLACFPKVLVVAVEGAAMGGGFGLACVADILLARKDAKFALSETTLGLVPAQIAPFVVARIGQAQTRRLALSGERIDAAEALRIGLVDAEAPEGHELRRAEQIAAAIARQAPLAVGALKQVLRQGADLPLAEALALEGRIFSALGASPDSQEGVLSFVEKREPVWSGICPTGLKGFV